MIWLVFDTAHDIQTYSLSVYFNCEWRNCEIYQGCILSESFFLFLRLSFFFLTVIHRCRLHPGCALWSSRSQNLSEFLNISLTLFLWTEPWSLSHLQKVCVVDSLLCEWSLLFEWHESWTVKMKKGKTNSLDIIHGFVDCLGYSTWIPKRTVVTNSYFSDHDSNEDLFE